jgi:uncharacterized membrane protein
MPDLSTLGIPTFGLSTLGFIHTAISLVALVTGFILIVRDRSISPNARFGPTYLVTTLLTAATALGIFRHGGFGPPHMLAIMTLAALALGWVATYMRIFGRAAPYVEAVCYSATYLFHLIPGFTETLTRLPVGAPIAASAQDPILQVIAATLLALFLVWVVWQIWRLSARAR